MQLCGYRTLEEKPIQQYAPPISARILCYRTGLFGIDRKKA
jgi:hypothetical protein